MSPNTPPRAPGCAYVGLARYFVTVCTFNREKWFAIPDVAGEIAAQIPPFYASCDLTAVAYCVMPDHVHLLLEGSSENADLVQAVLSWKQRSAFAWKRRTGARLWQKGFYDRVLRESDDTAAVVRYILENPVRARLVRAVSDYAWIGSSAYELNELLEHAGQWRPERKRDRAG